MSIRILLVEDHQLVREGTRRILEQSADLQVVGEAADGDEALRLVDELLPDVILMDVRMPNLNGIKTTQAIKARYPTMRILALSAHEDDHYVFPLLEAGANGYLLKTASPTELIAAIRAVYAGSSAFDHQIAGKMVHRMAHGQLYRSEEMVEGLTGRQLEVLAAVAEGKTNREIGASLSISAQTVQVHLRNIFAKLGVSNRAEAVVYAIGQGWLNVESPHG